MNTPNPPPAQASTKLVLVALGLALAAVVVVNLYVQHVRNQVAADSFTVYRLNRPVEVGDTFREDMADALRWPLSFRDSARGFVMDEALRSHVGDRFQQSVDQGQLLQSEHFLEAAGARESSRIPLGMRRHKLTINPRNVPGNLRPEMIVDILAPFSTGRGVEPLPVMEAVRIVAVGARTAESYADDPRRARPASGFHTITIEVTPEEVVQLSTIEKLAVGDFELAERNPADTERKFIPGGGVNPRLIAIIESAKPQIQRQRFEVTGNADDADQ